MYVRAIPAAKMAAAECPKLSKENTLNILKWLTWSNLAENTLKVNNLQNSTFLILWLNIVDNILINP